jgi:N-acetylglucosaminyldiphosphoundecaprenol N-acetyl-beta-D-mannosaminyltransferase
LTKPEFYRIGKVPVHVTSVPDARDRILSAVAEGEKGYVCVSNMRTLVTANRDSAYREVMEHSLLNVPDGTPLVWCGKAWGLKQVQRVVGVDLFEALLRTDATHFFLGDTEETLQALTAKVSETGARVAGSYSPPFAPLEEYDLQGIADRINASGAQLVWTSLRAPKQDFLAAKLLPYMDHGVVFIGIGAAFRLYLGEYELDRGVLQKVGLGGLKMLRNTTVWKELKWYVSHTFILAGYLMAIIWKRLHGKPCDK